MPNLNLYQNAIKFDFFIPCMFKMANNTSAELDEEFKILSMINCTDMDAYIKVMSLLDEKERQNMCGEFNYISAKYITRNPEIMNTLIDNSYAKYDHVYFRTIANQISKRKKELYKKILDDSIYELITNHRVHGLNQLKEFFIKQTSTNCGLTILFPGFDAIFKKIYEAIVVLANIEFGNSDWFSITLRQTIDHTICILVKQFLDDSLLTKHIKKIDITVYDEQLREALLSYAHSLPLIQDW